MVEVEINCGYEWAAKQCEKHVGPRKFVLHNRIGGEGWEVSPYYGNTNIQRTKAKFKDPQMATFIMLTICQFYT